MVMTVPVKVVWVVGSMLRTAWAFADATNPMDAANTAAANSKRSRIHPSCNFFSSRENYLNLMWCNSTIQELFFFFRLLFDLIQGFRDFWSAVPVGAPGG